MAEASPSGSTNVHSPVSSVGASKSSERKAPGSPSGVVNVSSAELVDIVSTSSEVTLKWYSIPGVRLFSTRLC